MNRLFFFSFLLLLSLGCETPQQVITPTFPTHSEQINLNRIKMITKSEAVHSESKEEKKPLVKEPGVSVDYSENKIPFIQLDLFFEDAGISIIEEIIAGTILDHHIIVLNQKGEIIAKQPVNFQAYEILETKTEVMRNKVIVGESKKPVKVNSTTPETKISREAIERQYTDRDTVPQVLEILDGKVPNPGEYISIYLELTFVNPHLEPNCESYFGNCYGAKQKFFEDVTLRNRRELDILRNRYVEGEVAQFPNLTPAEQSEFKTNIKSKIDSTNGVFGPKHGFTKFYFREWNLVSSPRYFRILSINKNGKQLSSEERNEEKRQIDESHENSKSENDSHSIFDSPTHSKHKKRSIPTP
ncbi:hypothetical protein [Leptospira meyeri]|uniref:hypothetical protein n=1 Tax=Leptospira meyeri TaxID=29508 RepID=UPI000C29D00E|nr:hypothetical protein [Leptospira meyeri]PKA25484.1 hypothetical protein CH381_15155 [Leptospira sp. mixed culture ATI2-C-A1]PJZ81755.1 hypothetical protein CH359_07220 [Leptospira meyeri]PJZ97256.1 hypothetical protein CH358_08890 [Leptospira meyeri]PKA10769.1 hypothetical protein CH372_17690 [Leptospira meyeri]TGM19995.1 hypothetical protein EHQ73_17190 [Leptospira meyeri]